TSVSPAIPANGQGDRIGFRVRMAKANSASFGSHHSGPNCTIHQAMMGLLSKSPGILTPIDVVAMSATCDKVKMNRTSSLRTPLDATRDKSASCIEPSERDSDGARNHAIVQDAIDRSNRWAG